jgi:type IV secretion system protein VirB10
MTEAAAPLVAPAKVDPETLVLRGNPVRVTRFRRGAIIGIAAATSTAIAGIAWLALKPVHLAMPESRDETAQLAQKPSSDALAGAPAGYGDVPKLGPPLPGDLGRPIVERQRELAADGAAVPPPAAGVSAIEQEHERRLAEMRSARQSGVLVQLQGGSAAPTATMQVPASVADGPASNPSRASVDLEHDPNGQQRKIDFLAKTDADDVINPHGLMAPVSPWTLSAGSVIAASLLTGLDSDLPGMVTAQVTENVYDSTTGRLLLVPQGSRLVGDYDSVVAFGQSRALVVWKRIILPDGSSVQIDNMLASDAAGYAGLTGKIDRHSWQVLKGIALSTLLGVGPELSFGNSGSDLVQAIRESAQLNSARAADQLVGKTLDVQPTIRVRPGSPLRVLVQKDIVFARSGGPGG